MEKFKKRTFNSIGEFFEELKFIIKNRDQIKNQYGEHKSEIIKLAVRMINFGNLSGNSFDYLLYKLSFGLLGQSK